MDEDGEIANASPNELVAELFAKMDLAIKLERQGIKQNEEILEAIRNLEFSVRGVIENRNRRF